MKSYFVFLGRNKLYSLVTVFGFALSLAFVILVALYARNEFAVDSFHTNLDRIYRVEYGNATRCYTPPAMGVDLKAAYPEVENFTRYYEFLFEAKTPYGEMTELDCAIVDSSYFSIFSIPLIEGSPSSVMRGSNEVVISEKTARKFFGTTRGLIGRTIVAEGENRELIISGVYATAKNSALPSSDIFVRFDSWITGPIDVNYLYSVCTLILLEKQGTNLVEKSADFAQFLRGRGHQELLKNEVDTVTLRKFEEVYFSQVEQGFTEIGDLRFLIILMVTAIAILLFAVINYINLSVAQSGFRSREMATRRLLGSSAGAIFLKFIAESILLCAISFFIAVGVASLFQGLFNDLIQTSVDINAEFTFVNIVVAVGFVGLLGVVSGVVPSFVITKFNPIEVVRGTFTYRAKKIYSKILITFQYIITIALIGLATLVVRQTIFMQNLDLGFSTKNLYWTECFVQTNEEVNMVRSGLMQISGVEAVGFSKFTQLYYPQRISAAIGGSQLFFNTFLMDSTCFSMFDFRVKELSGNRSDTAVYINEMGLKRLGYDKMPDQIRSDDGKFCVALKGVVEDFHYSSLTDPVDIAIISSQMDWAQHVIVKTSNPNIEKQVKQVIDEITGGLPYKGNWLDQNVDAWSDKVERQSGLILWLSILAVVISALGMLAMATYFIRQRHSEIALRKVFGSSRQEVLVRLVWQFLQLVMVAYLLAAPIIWYFGNQWLEDFPYRVQIGAWEYIAAAVVAFGVAALSILGQAYRAAVENPATAVKK